MSCSRTLWLLGALLIASAPYSAVGALANQQQSVETSSETQFRSWIQSLSVDGTKVSTDDLTYDRAADVLTAKNFTISSPIPTGGSEAPAPALKIDTLKLKAFSSDTDGTRIASAIADNVAFVAPGQTGGVAERISHIEISGGFVPSLLAFKADAAKPVTSQIRLLRLLSKSNFQKITAEKLDFGPSFSVDHIQLGEISAGRISEAELSKVSTVFTPVKNATASDQAQRTLNVDSLSLSNLDTDAYLRLFEASAYLSAGTARPWSNFIGEVKLMGVKWENGPITLGIDAATLGPLKTRQFDENITDIFDNSARDPAYLSQNPAASTKLANAIRGAFSLEAAVVTGVTAHVPNQAGATTVNLGGASLANLTANHVDHLQFDVMNLADAGGSLGIQKLGLNDINLQNDALETAVLQPQPQGKLPTIGRVTAEAMKLNVGQMNFGFDKLDVAMSYFIGSTPTNVQATLEHLKFTADQIAAVNVKQALLDLGYKDIDLSVKVSGAWQDSASALAFDTIELKGLDIGTLSLSGSLTGITRASFENPAKAFPQEALAGGLQNLRITFENASLFDRFIALVAKQNNKSVDDLKRLLSANMPSIMSRISSQQTRNKFILAAVSFINNPKILQLLTTTSDVTMLKDVLASLPEPYNLPAVLKLDASANQRK